jgi:hypothetical protein
MGNILIENDLEFDFRAAISAVRFDDENHKMSHCMKAVDFLVEWDKEFWLVEVKDPSSRKIPNKFKDKELREFINKMRNQTLFAHELGPKLKDSFLYLSLRNRLPEKPLKYVVLLAIESFDTALLSQSMEHLKRYSCLMAPDNLYWSKKYIDGIAIYNEKTWNETLNKCPVYRKN